MPMFVSADPVALRQATTGGMYDATTEFLRNRLDSLSQLGNIPQGFVDSAWKLYDQFHGSEMMRQVKAVGNQLGGLFKADGLQELFTISDFQQAKPIMQRVVMACPDYRSLFLNYEADGYSETYVNIHGSDIGEKHEDYRLLMDGMLQEDAEGELSWRFYFVEQTEDDPLRVTANDKIMAQRVFDRVRLMVAKRGQDPGSIYCDDF